MNHLRALKPRPARKKTPSMGDFFGRIKTKPPISPNLDPERQHFRVYPGSPRRPGLKKDGEVSKPVGGGGFWSRGNGDLDLNFGLTL